MEINRKINLIFGIPLSLMIFMFLFRDRITNTLDTFNVTFSSYKMEERNVELK